MANYMVTVKNMEFSDIVFDGEKINFYMKIPDKIKAKNYLKVTKNESGEIELKPEFGSGEAELNYANKEILSFYPDYIAKELSKIDKKNIFFAYDTIKAFDAKNAKSTVLVDLYVKATDFTLPKSLNYRLKVNILKKSVLVDADKTDEYIEKIKQKGKVAIPNEEDIKNFREFMQNTLKKMIPELLAQKLDIILIDKIKDKDIVQINHLISKSLFSRKLESFYYLYFSERLKKHFKMPNVIPLPNDKEEEEIAKLMESFFNRFDSVIDENLQKYLKKALSYDYKDLDKFKGLDKEFYSIFSLASGLENNFVLADYSLSDYYEQKDFEIAFKNTEPHLFYIENLKEYKQKIFFIPIFQPYDSKKFDDIKFSNLDIIEINGKKYITNITKNSKIPRYNLSQLAFHLQNGRIKIEQISRPLINAEIKTVESLKEDFAKIDLKKSLFLLTPIGKISIKEPFIKDPTVFPQEKAEVKNIEELISNPVSATVLKISSKAKFFEEIAKRNKMKLNAHNLIIKPSQGSKNFPEHLKSEKISKENLGMLEFGFIPILDIREEADKEKFLKEIEKFTKEKVEEFNEEKFNQLKEAVKKGDFIITGVEPNFNSESYVLRKYFAPVVIDESLNQLGKINLSITQYKDFLKQSNIANMEDFIKEPQKSSKFKYELLTGVVSKQSLFYKNLLGEDGFKKAYQNALKFIGKKNEMFDVVINESNKKNFLEIAKIYLDVLTKENVLKREFDGIQKEIKIMNINPLLKARLQGFFNDPLNIINEKDQLNSLLIEVQQKNKQNAKQIEDFVRNTLEKVDTVIKSVKKETLSYIYITAMAFNLKAIKKDNPKNEELLKKAYRYFELWGNKAVGLSKEQFNDAINGIYFFSKKRDLKVINYAYSMGTGKTRLALFTMYLLSVLNKESYFAIQNKNRDDIYGQLVDMLPSLGIYTAQYFNANVDFANASNFPFGLIKDMFPNIFNSYSQYIVNSKSKTKKEIIENYYTDLKSIQNEIIENKNLNDVKDIIVSSDNFKELYEHFNKKAKGLKASSLFVNIDKTKADRYIHRFLRNYATLVLYLDHLHSSGNLKPEGIRKIKEFLTKTIDKQFESLFDYLNKQADKKMNLIANTYYSYFPKKEKETIKHPEYKELFTDQKVSFNVIENEIEFLLESAKDAKKDFSNYVEIIQKEFYKSYTSNVNDKFYGYYLSSIGKWGLKLDEYLKRITEKIFTFEGLECPHIAQKAIEKIIDRVEVRKDFCPFIKMDESPLEYDVAEGIKFSNQEILEILADEKLSDEEKDKIKDILKNFNLYANDITLSLGLSLFNSPYVPSFAKEDFINVKDINKKNFTFTAYKKQNILHPILKADFINKQVEGSFKEFKKLQAIYLNSASFEAFKLYGKKLESEIKFTNIEKVKFNIKGLRKKVELFFKDAPLAITRKINLNSPYLIEFNGLNKFIVNDEAHKNVDRNINVVGEVLENNGRVITLTGTPINGKSDSIVDKLAPHLDENERKTKSNFIVFGAGNFNIKSSDLILFVKRWDEIKKSIKTYKDKHSKFSASEIKNILESHLHWFSDNDKSAILEFIEENFENIEQVNVEQPLALIAKKSDLKIASGISNPFYLSRIVEELGSLTAIKDSKERIWDIKDLDRLTEGFNPEHTSFEEKQKVKNFSQDYNLADIQLLFALSKYMPLYAYLSDIRRAVDGYLENINDEKELKEFNIKYGTKLKMQEFLELITPVSASGKDTVGQLVFDILTNENIEGLGYSSNKIEFAKKLLDNYETFIKDIRAFLPDNFASKEEMFFVKEYKVHYKDTKKPVPLSLDIPLFDIFGRVFKDKFSMKLELFSTKTEEIKEEIINYSSDLTINSLKEDKNVINFSTRIKLLILKISETLEKLARENLQEPVYILINASSSKEFQEFLNAIDIEKLKDKNIYIIKTNTQNMYKDYNYVLPKKAKFAIFSIYSSLAEGFRFPRAKTIIYNGNPNNIATLVQSMARAFAPKINNEVSIYLTSEKFNINMLKKEDFLKEKKEGNIKFKVFSGEEVRIKGYHSISFEELNERVSKIIFDEVEKRGIFNAYLKYVNLLNDMNLGVKPGIYSPLKNDYLNSLKEVTNSVITSLQFMGSTIGTYKEEFPQEIFVMNEALKADKEDTKEKEGETLREEKAMAVKVKK